MGIGGIPTSPKREVKRARLAVRASVARALACEGRLRANPRGADGVVRVGGDVFVFISGLDLGCALVDL